MAEFSKQWCDRNDPGGITPSFDILEEANNLEPEHYIPIICEGYGFVAISKDEYGGIHLAFRDNEDNVNWVDYNEIVK